MSGATHLGDLLTLTDSLTDSDRQATIMTVAGGGAIAVSDCAAMFPARDH